MSAAPPDPVARRPLGSTGLSVTPLAIGCAPLGDMPQAFAYGVPEEQAMDALRAAFRGPISFVDTAASYGDGESERRIGIVLRELGGLPDGYVLATKADRDLRTGDFSGDQVRRSVDRSLRLLGLDRLAICYLHDPEHTTFAAAMAPGGPVEALRRLKDEGVVGHVGLAGGPIDMSMQYLQTGHFELVITHNRYTLLNRAAAPLLDLAARQGVPLMNAAPYGSGILAKGPDAYPRYAYQQAPPALLAEARRADDLCRQFGVPLAAAALQFSLREPRIAATIVGMSRAERIAQTVELARQPIPEALWQQLAALSPVETDPETTRWRKG